MAILVYPIKLIEEERKELHQYLHQGIASARSLNRARMLLMADEGHSDDCIAEALQVAKSIVARIRGRYCQKGLESALKEKPRSGAPPKIDRRAKILRMLKKETKPWQKQQWCIGQITSDFISRMENILDLYQQPYGPKHL